jgi:energy-coupling factor transporter ATP-binding protein EcfA2
MPRAGSAPRTSYRARPPKPRLLLLVEPGAGLDAGESADLAGLLRRHHAEGGLSVLLIEQDVPLDVFLRHLAKRWRWCDRGHSTPSRGQVLDGNGDHQVLVGQLAGRSQETFSDPYLGSWASACQSQKYW